MARKTSKFMIGLFVTFGVLIGLAAIIWLGASNYFEKGKMYVTYFDESVQGLQVDSAVKFRGVEVGRVEQIRVAPDNHLIEVVMKIDMSGPLDRECVAQLRTAGITGIVFVDLDRKTPGQPVQSPKLTFKPEYPVIPSRPSQLKLIISGVEEIIQKIEQIDTKGISDQIKATAKEIEDFIGGERMSKIITEVDSAATHLNGVMTNMDQALSQGKIERILTEAENSMIKIQDLTADVQTELHALELARTGANLQDATAKLDRILGSGDIEAILAEVKATLFKAQATMDGVKNAIESLRLNETVAAADQLIEGVDRRTRSLALRFDETAGKADHLIDGLDQRADGLIRDFMATTESLRRTLESFRELLDRIRADPSALIFSQPPPPRENKE